MKRKLFILLILSLFLFSSCKPRMQNAAGKIKIVSTIFPIYDWTRCIAGEQNGQIILSMLVKNGVDLHSYQPAASDIVQISTCDLFIYVGGESDKWVQEALSSATNKNMKVLNLMEILGDNVKEEEVVEGMQAETKHEAEETEDEIEYDEHIWLSLKNAKICCNAIYNALCQIDAQNTELYTSNFNKYCAEIELLDQQFSYAAHNATQTNFIFCDRFPFRYFMDDYGLTYYAAFTGCSAETEASFETVAFLAQKVTELNVKYVYTIETGSEKLPKTILSNAHNYTADIIRIDSMQSTTLRSAIGGKTYLNSMRKNMEELEKGLK